MSSPGYRRISRDACTWCGHKRHDRACRSSIQTGIKAKKPVMERCPCRAHERRTITTPTPTEGTT